MPSPKVRPTKMTFRKCQYWHPERPSRPSLWRTRLWTAGLGCGRRTDRGVEQREWVISKKRAKVAMMKIAPEPCDENATDEVAVAPFSFPAYRNDGPGERRLRPTGGVMTVNETAQRRMSDARKADVDVFTAAERARPCVHGQGWSQAWP